MRDLDPIFLEKRITNLEKGGAPTPTDDYFKGTIEKIGELITTNTNMTISYDLTSYKGVIVQCDVSTNNESISTLFMLKDLLSKHKCKTVLSHLASGWQSDYLLTVEKDKATVNADGVLISVYGVK